MDVRSSGLLGAKIKKSKTSGFSRTTHPDYSAATGLKMCSEWNKRQEIEVVNQTTEKLTFGNPVSCARQTPEAKGTKT
jgi:hypothetical protein